MKLFQQTLSKTDPTSLPNNTDIKDLMESYFGNSTL